jgi:hypothetical protein
VLPNVAANLLISAALPENIPNKGSRLAKKDLFVKLALNKNPALANKAF